MPDPEFKAERVEYVDGFGAKLSASIVQIVDDDDDDGGGGWFNWRRKRARALQSTGGGSKTASGRLRFEDESDSWF